MTKHADRAIDAPTRSALGALRHPRYRSLFVGSALAGLGNSMQQLAIGWLAVEIAVREQRPDHAPLYVGLVGLARFGPGLVFGLIGGLMADRMEKRALLMAMRVLSAAVSAALAAMVAADLAGIGSLMALTLVATAAFTIDLPVRIALTPALVRPADLFSAFSLIRTTSQASLLVGPLLAGLLIVPFGIAGALLASAAAYAASAAVIAGLPAVPPGGATGGALRTLADGVRYIRATPIVLALTIYAAAYAVFGQSYIHLLPAVAHDSLGVGAVELSWLVAAAGLGALLGTFAVTLFGRVAGVGRLLLGNALVMGVLLALFGLQTGLPQALAAVLALSVASVTFFGLWGNVVQSYLPDEVRGRVNGIHVSIFHAGMPLGTLLLGAAGTFVGLPLALALGAAVVLAATLAVASRPLVREARLGPRFSE